MIFQLQYKMEIQMKVRGLYIAVLTTLGLSACSIDSDDNVADIAFEDSFIENCVYQKQWQTNNSGEFQHSPTLVSEQGVLYQSESNIPLTEIRKVSDCDTYNIDYFGTGEMLSRALHLRDLDKLPFLKTLNLDFDVADYSALTYLDQIETLQLSFYSDSIDEYNLPLRYLNDMESLEEVVVYGDLYQDYGDLRYNDTIRNLQFWMPEPKVSAVQAGDLPMNLHSLVLANTWLADASEYKKLSNLSEFVFVPKSMPWEYAEGVVEPDYRIFEDFENLRTLKLKFTSFDDLSVIQSTELETLNLTMGINQFNQMDWSKLDHFSNLKNIMIATYEELPEGRGVTPDSRMFNIRYYEYERYLEGEYEGQSFGSAALFDTMYAVMMLTPEQAVKFSSDYDLELVGESYDGSLYPYRVSGLNMEKVVDLYQRWMQGEITTFQ